MFCKNSLLGDIVFLPRKFKGIETIINDFIASFPNKNSIIRNKIVNDTLFSLIKEHNNDFCLMECIDYMAKITKHKLLDGAYNFTAFEKHINNNCSSKEDEYLLRAKITGKYIPRDEYQHYFPIGKDKFFQGSHTVSAHNPPDLDSTCASFFSWLDAFSCKVGTSLHIWNIPQGRPNDMISSLFEEIFSKDVFYRVAKHKTLLSHVALDFVKHENLMRLSKDSNIRKVSHKRHTNHMILVDEEGYYLGDWRISDVDEVNQVQRLLERCLHSYEQRFMYDFTKVLSKSNLSLNDIDDLIASFTATSLTAFEQEKNIFEEDEIVKLTIYLTKILTLPKGCKTSMKEFFYHMDEMSKCNFASFIAKITEFKKYFSCEDKKENSRERMFFLLHESYKSLIQARKTLHNYLDRLEIAMKIKQFVLNFEPHFVTTKANIAEIKSRMRNHSHITVVFNDRQNRLIPVGLIHRKDIYQNVLGTVSIRDFCNKDEIKLENHLKIISAMDHHKSSLTSKEVMTLNVADVQSCNVLLAEKAFLINDKYSSFGIAKEDLQQQIHDLTNLENKESYRLLQVLSTKLASSNSYFIAEEREFIEYLFFLHAILDDTDLLVKATWRDLTCICNLLNRLKSIQTKRVVEVFSLEEYKRDNQGLRKAISDLLKNEELYSFYKKIYIQRQDYLDEIINKVEQSFDLFLDKKVQNQSCLVSQFKLFDANKKAFYLKRNSIMQRWLQLNGQQAKKNAEIDLFIHMTSTIISYKEAYNNDNINLDNKDEIWLNINLESDESTSRFRQFISYMNNNLEEKNINLEIKIEGKDKKFYSKFEQLLKSTSFKGKISFQENELESNIIVLLFKQGSLNSRKADITPFLPFKY